MIVGSEVEELGSVARQEGSAESVHFCGVGDGKSTCVDRDVLLLLDASSFDVSREELEES